MSSLLAVRGRAGNPALKSLSNSIYFQKRRILMSSVFVAGFGFTCYNARSWNQEVLRMGVAGSLAYTVCETSFHFIDTINIRSKAS